MIFARQSLTSHWREFGKSSVLVAASGVFSAGLLEIFTQIIMATAQMMRLSAVMPMPIRRPLFLILVLVGFSSMAIGGAIGSAGSGEVVPDRSGSLSELKLFGFKASPMAPLWSSAYGAS